MSKVDLVKKLNQGKIGVMPTDTIYGLVGCALMPETVVRLYKVRKRSPHKPFIILISGLNDFKLFGIRLTVKQKNKLESFWPGPVSVILTCNQNKFAYLHRGTETLAFRYPKDSKLLRIIQKTGPLVAPSANPEGLLPAKNIKEAKKYFGKGVDFYKKGKVKYTASTLIFLSKTGQVNVERQGMVKFSKSNLKN